jgi:hypothetical protein
MKYINKTDFLNWVKTQHIQIEEWSQNYSLSLKHNSFSTSWIIPESARMPYFFQQVLNNVDNWEKCFIWKKEGRWDYSIRDINRFLENIWANLIHKIGVPQDFEGAIEYKKSDLIDLVTLLQVQCTFAWCGADEFFIVFDHAQQMIFVDDARTMHVKFVNKERLDKFVSDLSSNKYSEFWTRVDENGK